VELLRAWDVEQLVDVRTVPRSRAVPWAWDKKLAVKLPEVGIAYVHLGALGGLRRAGKDSPNKGWENASFRGYADYMQTAEFAEGLRALNELRKARRTCVMCSEAVWWRCHRRMIADAEVARGIPVKHIMSATVAKGHEMTGFAVVERRRGRGVMVRYPG
jgi:uncharacterized protein (DUF488 family)